MIKLKQYIKQSIINFVFISISCCINNNAAANVATNPDSEQPINIQSDTANFDNIKGIALYVGHVTVVQGSRHLFADKLSIERDANNRIKIMIATGNPATFYSQPDPAKPKGQGKAKTIKFYPQQDNVDLLGNAQLTQNGDTITGPMLNYNFATESLSSKSNKSQRATCVLQPRRES